MAEVVGSRVERRRKSARERRAQALRAQARRFRRPSLAVSCWCQFLFAELGRALDDSQV